MATPICANCRYYYAQWPDSTYCEFCNYQSPNIFCSQCHVNSAKNACLCAFPLPVFCSDCSFKHNPSDEHSVQSLSVLSLLKTREQYEWHRVRLNNIDVVQSKLNMWCKNAVERAKVELAKTVKKLHSLLDSQFEELKSELEETNKKIDRVCQCLDDMKEDYSLQSGTHFDAIVDWGMTETQLRSLESLFEYTVNLVDPAYPILSSMIHLIDKIPDVNRQRKIIQEKEANPMSDFSQFKEDLAQYQQPQFVASVARAPDTWSKKCSVCAAAIADTQWHSTVPETLKVYSAMLADFCSLQCLNSFHIISKSSGDNKCVGCKAALLHYLKSDLVLLECGHMFHSKFCFENYVTDYTHRCTCPECNTDIHPEIIDKELIAGKAKEIEENRALLTCGICGNGKRKMTSYCQFGHKVCTECDYSIVEFWFRNPKCRVCREGKAKSNVKAIPHNQ